MNENNTLDLTKGGSTAFKMVPYLRLTVKNNTYTLSTLVTVPSDSVVGDCTVNTSGDAVIVDIPVTNSGTSEHWKAVLRTCSLPDTGSVITSRSIVTVNVNETTSMKGDVDGEDSTEGNGSSQVTYEDAEEE